ncbi:SDR family NAD(P)-dependent oxidoreductase [Shewanella gaetbuli]
MPSSHQIKQAVLITGATSGIGLACAEYYTAKGFNVIACGRNQSVLNSLNVSHTLGFDITNAQQVKQAAAELQQYLASEQLTLQQVILNAGTCEYVDDVMHFDASLFSRVIETNLVAVGYCIESFLPLITAKGQLGLMSSSAIYLPFSRAQAYGASKAAIDYLGRSLRLDLNLNPVTEIGVSVICPGFVATPLTDKNDFDMPMRISSEQAAVEIFNGMAKKQFEIHFPKKFTRLLKFLSWLPENLQLKILAKISH